MAGEDAGNVAYLEGTRVTEDDDRRRLGRLEWARIHDEDHYALTLPAQCSKTLNVRVVPIRW